MAFNKEGPFSRFRLKFSVLRLQLVFVLGIAFRKCVHDCNEGLGKAIASRK